MSTLALGPVAYIDDIYISANNNVFLWLDHQPAENDRKCMD